MNADYVGAIFTQPCKCAIIRKAKVGDVFPEGPGIEVRVSEEKDHLWVASPVGYDEPCFLVDTTKIMFDALQLK